MERLKELVHGLVTADVFPVPVLQQINEALLKEYQLTVAGSIRIIPKDVEIYYVARKARHPYVDQNMHCILDPKTNDAIWALQSDRFGQVYAHKKGNGGLDICLSDSPDYALCCTLKAAEINGEVCWSTQKVRSEVFRLLAEQDGTPIDKAALTDRLNAPHAYVMLSRREHPLTGHVYHLRRKGLRRRDKNVLFPLRAFMDIWNDKLAMNRVQKINLYMDAHPSANVLDVLREHNFRYIPADIKIKFHLDKHTKLYE